MEVSWASAEAWERAALASSMEGKRPAAGPICRDCLRLIPRMREDRLDIVDSMCKCGHTTTIRADEEAHGIQIRAVASGRLYE